MTRALWGWFDAAPAAIRDHTTGVVHPVAVPTSEAAELGITKRRMVVFDADNLLEVVPADVAGVVEFDPAGFCVCFHAPESADWVVIRQRDGAKARIRRDLGLT